MKRIKFLLSICATLALAACGGGGGSPSNSTTTTPVVVTPPTIVLLAGSYYGAGNMNGEGTKASLYQPASIVTDSAGNMFFSDSANSTIRKISPTGVVTSFAGASGKRGAIDGAGETARFDNPIGLAIDKNDNLYVGDPGNYLIRKITPAGMVSTLAGGALNESGDIRVVNGVGTNARFAFPYALVVDSVGNVFVADYAANNVRKITPAGMVSTFAGSNDQFQRGSTDGTGVNARFRSPRGITIDSNDNIYVADTGNATIRKITPAAVVSTFAGKIGSKGSTDGTLSDALFDYPRAIHFDRQGNILIAEALNNTIRKISPSGNVSTLAGTANTQGGFADSVGAAARFDFPRGLTSDSAGNLYVADTSNNAIRKVTQNGAVSTWVGHAASRGASDGVGAAATFSSPSGIVVDSAESYYVADTGNQTIRKITASGVVTTIAGTVGQSGYEDGMGSVVKFASPGGLTIDSAGNLFVLDTGNHRIRKITPSGLVSSFAGGGTGIGTDGIGSMANFSFPEGITIDSNNNLFVADSGNNTIRMISPLGSVTSIAGNANADAGSNDGISSFARFNAPAGIAVDKTGNVFVADFYNHTIRKITRAGIVTTIVGKTGESGTADGEGANARLNFPSKLTINNDGDLFVTDSANSTIRKITPAGMVSTVAGITGIANLSPDPTSKTLAYPQSLTFDNRGKLFTTMNHGVFQVNF